MNNILIEENQNNSNKNMSKKILLQKKKITRKILNNLQI